MSTAAGALRRLAQAGRGIATSTPKMSGGYGNEPVR
jgi:hypothetical protein